MMPDSDLESVPSRSNSTVRIRSSADAGCSPMRRNFGTGRHQLRSIPALDVAPLHPRASELLEPGFLRNIVGKLTLLSRSATGLQAQSRVDQRQGPVCAAALRPLGGTASPVACRVGRVRGPVGLTTCVRPGRADPPTVQPGRAMPTVTAGLR